LSKTLQDSKAKRKKAATSADREGRTIWIAVAHRDRKRFVVRADEMLTAFVEVESRWCDSIKGTVFGFKI